MKFPEYINWHLALVIDGEVVDVMHTPDRLAAILMSNPTVVSVKETELPMVGATYDEKTGAFSQYIQED